MRQINTRFFLILTTTFVGAGGRARFQGSSASRANSASSLSTAGTSHGTSGTWTAARTWSMSGTSVGGV